MGLIFNRNKKMIIKFHHKGNKISDGRKYSFQKYKAIFITNPKGKTEKQLTKLFYNNSDDMQNIKKLLIRYRANFMKVRKQPILKLKEI